MIRIPYNSWNKKNECEKKGKPGLFGAKKRSVLFREKKKEKSGRKEENHKIFAHHSESYRDSC